MPDQVKDQYPFRPDSSAKEALPLLIDRYPRSSINKLLIEAVLEKAVRDCCVTAEQIDVWKVQPK